MNNEPTSDERQKLVAAAADSYTAPLPQSHTVLMPIRDSLATLRRKGASYRTIARILRNVEIKVSLDTLARFCREQVEQTADRKEKRRPASRRTTEPPEEPPPSERPPSDNPDFPASNNSGIPASVNPPKEADTPPPFRGKGPRIADPSNV